MKCRADDVSVNVKIASDVDKKISVLTLFGISGVCKIIRLFPSETDPELANLFLVKIRRKDRCETLKKIRPRRMVEYADIASRRQLA